MLQPARRHWHCPFPWQPLSLAGLSLQMAVLLLLSLLLVSVTNVVFAMELAGGRLRHERTGGHLPRGSGTGGYYNEHRDVTVDPAITSSRGHNHDPQSRDLLGGLDGGLTGGRQATNVDLAASQSKCLPVAGSAWTPYDEIAQP